MKTSVTLLVTLVTAVCLLTGCKGIENKATVLDASVQGARITSGADVSSGAPLPNCSAGWGSNLMIGVPMDKAGSLSFKKKTASFWGTLFGLNVSDEVEVSIVAGAGKATVTTNVPASSTVTTKIEDGAVTVSVKDGSSVSVPGNAVQAAATAAVQAVTGK